MRGLSIAALGSATLLLGCSKDPGTTGTGGGGATSATTTSASTDASTSSVGGSAPCRELHLGKVHEHSNAYFEVDILENVDGPAKDYLSISFWYSPTQTLWSGPQDLGSDQNANFATCTTCVNVYADDAMGTVYFQAGGTLDLGTATIDWDGVDSVLWTDGSVKNAKFVEVYVDGETRVTTPVPGGKCFEIVDEKIAMTPPPPAWTCDVATYDDGGDCDCKCGVIDPDCSLPGVKVQGCAPGQSCDASTATCAGVPSTWTCPPGEYGGGAANGCDCGCGAHDPDCDLIPAPPLDHCAAGETCNGNDKCVPPTWTCDKEAYDDALDECDCGCAVQDPDCLSPAKAACAYCNLTGSCDTLACNDPASKIQFSNNALCN
jgi:hypothetical protein